MNPGSPPQPSQLDCANAIDYFRGNLEGGLSPQEQLLLDGHLKGCSGCHEAHAEFARMHGLLDKLVGQRGLSKDFEERSRQRLKARQVGGTSSQAMGAVSLSLPEDESEDLGASKEGLLAATMDRFGSAPWWAVSVVLHVLVILLLGLITMSIGLQENEKTVIVLTNLEKMAAAKPEEEKAKAKPDAREILESKHETPATDPNATPQSNIVVPPDILAKAELGDHFETINLDRPDTQSAFGNPEARMFHSASGNDEPEGGGGLGGNSLMDNLIGLGGASSPGTGGGWGGGNGTGTGLGNGSGHGSFGQRNGGGRKLMVMRHGGSKVTESAVDKALEWLARHQEADGHWDCAKHGASRAGDTAMCGLAVLAFLGAGHTEKIGKYKDNVKRGVQWLISQQNAQGRVYKDGENAPIGYCHPIAGLALAEAAGMGRIKETREAAQKAVDYSINVHQEGQGSERLGWRYVPKEMGDTSIVGWFTMQLKSAKVAGLQVDPAAFEGVSKFLDSVEVEKSKPGDPYSGHRYGYRRDGNPIRVKSPHGNTSIGCLCRQFLGVKREELQGGVEFFVKEGGVPNAQKAEFYHWYYATLCCFQQGGDIWKQWNEALKTSLLGLQRKGGDEDGSWDPVGHSVEGAEASGGRVFTTAIGALCLEVYYRYLPMYRE